MRAEHRGLVAFDDPRETEAILWKQLQPRVRNQSPASNAVKTKTRNPENKPTHNARVPQVADYIWIVDLKHEPTAKLLHSSETMRSYEDWQVCTPARSA